MRTAFMPRAFNQSKSSAVIQVSRCRLSRSARLGFAEPLAKGVFILGLHAGIDGWRDPFLEGQPAAEVDAAPFA